jgi:hypothetical protein
MMKQRDRLLYPNGHTLIFASPLRTEDKQFQVHTPNRLCIGHFHSQPE